MAYAGMAGLENEPDTNPARAIEAQIDHTSLIVTLSKGHEDARKVDKAKSQSFLKHGEASRRRMKA